MGEQYLQGLPFYFTRNSSQQQFAETAVSREEKCMQKEDARSVLQWCDQSLLQKLQHGANSWLV